MTSRDTLRLHRRDCLILLGGTSLLSACSGGGMPPEAYEGMMPDGEIHMREFQAAYIGSGTAGKGTLLYRGQSYPFDVGGLGVGGVGLSEVEAEGWVYRLNNILHFPGAYGQLRYGFAAGQKSGGDLLLENESGVIMRVRAKREGLMLSLGADVMRIRMT
ncbi:conserved protein of unknown function [Rhodovastum atsumiense]|uniref:DUF1134 domain-containing protein n=1 Tax=Rhodovastum atsumiense TaxID=504468 RepID=A0A5M6ITP4_9PROT|nr:hypothetical protein [Rhodovastum atsumiense]KAA5611207.1 hypothetical protein F1189_15680 [Rhodovastum atsumiense]CAH2602483.1 conserved protein of unknown function [Rhodovastum atsumiense]